MKLRTACLSALGVFIFSGTLLQLVRIDGVMPNLVLVLSVIFAVLYSLRSALAFAVVSGILQDLFLGRMLSVYVVIYVIVVLVSARSVEVVFKGNYLTPVLLIVTGTLIFHVLFFLVMFFFQAQIPLSILYRRIGIELIYNVLIGQVLYSLFYRRVHGYKLGDRHA